MDNIDIIYYNATSTNQLGEVSYIQAQYYLPFFDFLLVLLVLVFTIVTVYFVDYLCYPKKILLHLKNTLHITKRAKRSLD